MLSGNEHSHDERLTADDADGKTDFLAGVGLKNVRENKKTPIGEEGAGDSTEVNIFPQGTIFQNIGAEKSIAHKYVSSGEGESLFKTTLAQFANPVTSFADSSLMAAAALLPDFFWMHRKIVSATESAPGI